MTSHNSDTSPISALCDAAMLAGVRYAQRNGIARPSENPFCQRFLAILKPALKAILNRTLDEAKENPQLIGLMAEAMKVEFVAAGIDAAKAAMV